MGKLGKRQMIVFAVMGIVIVCTAVVFLVPKKKVSTPSVTQQTAGLNTFMHNLNAGLVKDTTKNLNALIFSRAEKEWKQDPFLDAKTYRSWNKAREPAKVVAAAPKSQFAYTGYLEVSKGRMAIINGMEYREGEDLDVKGFLLKSVSPARVVIENSSTKATQKVPLQD